MGQAKFAVLLAAALAALAPGQGRADEVVVFAAASLKTALDRVAADFTAETGHQVVISYAGSNQLAKQILQGAPADLFLSASEPWMDEVVKGGAAQDGSAKLLLGNALVLVGAPDAADVALGRDTDLPALLADRPLAMGLVDAVPAGQYGKAALEHLGLWTQVEPKVAQADNVRAALMLVERGEAAYGVVYASDAAASDKVRIVAEFPADSHPPIRYPVALLTPATDAGDRAFYDALFAAPAGAHFSAEGFVLAPQ